MNKYFYLFGTIISFFSFQIGWGNYLDHGFNIFSLGFMGITPITSFILATIWIQSKNKEDNDMYR